MIVKNETKVIKRCLDSVRPIIDCWVIVDTGSEDGTQELIKETLKDIPGTLYERPWINFGHNRNEALQLAKNRADYILFIDADEVLVYNTDFKLPPLDKDFYHIMTHFNGTKYARVQLIKNALNWSWVGVLHESVVSNDAHTNGILQDVFNDVHTDGARSSDPDKYKKDVAVLKEGLRNEPDNSRYMFYLAQSYRDAGDYENSLKHFQKRTEMGGWKEEIYWSLLQSAILEQSLEKPPETFLASYFNAHQYRPARIEPLYHMANYYTRTGEYARGYSIATIATKLPETDDILFVQQWMYDYGIWLELSVCAYWLDKFDECAQISKKLLTNPHLPQNIRECVEKNLACANLKLARVEQEL